jgi:hypothetical protein
MLFTCRCYAARGWCEERVVTERRLESKREGLESGWFIDRQDRKGDDDALH